MLLPATILALPRAVAHVKRVFVAPVAVADVVETVEVELPARLVVFVFADACNRAVAAFEVGIIPVGDAAFAVGVKIDAIVRRHFAVLSFAARVNAGHQSAARLDLGADFARNDEEIIARPFARGVDQELHQLPVARRVTICNLFARKQRSHRAHGLAAI